MYHAEIVSKYLKKIGQYPHASVKSSSGIKLTAGNDYFLLAGSPYDLIELADLLVSLALSGENKGQHWHIDQQTLVSENSAIGELILERTDEWPL